MNVESALKSCEIQEDPPQTVCAPDAAQSTSQDTVSITPLQVVLLDGLKDNSEKKR